MCKAFWYKTEKQFCWVGWYRAGGEASGRGFMVERRLELNIQKCVGICQAGAGSELTFQHGKPCGQGS